MLIRVILKKELFFNKTIEEYLQNHPILNGNFVRCHERFFNVYYDIEMPPQDCIKQLIKEGYSYEGNIGLMIRDLITPKSIVIDVGAHIGVHTVTMSRKVGPLGAVIAFEPKKELYRELLHTLTINQCDNVIPIAKGLGNQHKEEHLENIYIVQNALPSEESEAIEILPLGSFNLTNVSLIKIDIENYEYFALQGAVQTILKNQPVIIFECWIDRDYASSSKEKRENFDRVTSLIRSLGYEIYVIYANDFIAFPAETTKKMNRYKTKLKKLDLNHFDLGF